MTEKAPPPSATDSAEIDPGVASAEQGQVILDGPDGVAVTMTAEAAKDTAESLLRAAEEASGRAKPK
jgi:hypothetical protein